MKTEVPVYSSHHNRSMTSMLPTSVMVIALMQSLTANGADNTISVIPLEAKVPTTSSIDNRGLQVFNGKTQVIGGQVQYGYLINQSHMVLDCQGAILDGGGRIPTGVLIDSGGGPLEDVVIKNCTFKNFKYNGIRIGWSIKDVLKSSIRQGDLYQYHPKNIKIENVKILNSGTVGVYIDDYVSHVDIKNSEVSGSGYVGVYYEFSSKNNALESSLISHNGYGRLMNGTRNNTRREGVSVDSSEGNIIYNNVFKNNALGSLFLYKNCQEDFSKGQSAKRILGASNNIIKNNEFIDEKIGIWIASRQSRDLKKWDCGDDSIYQGRFFLDFADGNSVLNNNFCNVQKGIIVEGDRNELIGNSFKGDFFTGIFQPITARQKYLNRPPVGNVYKDNNFDKNIQCESK